MSRTGRQGSITYAKETTWGNYASATKYLRVVSESVNRSIEMKEDPSLISEIYTTDMIKVADGIGGTIETVIHGDECGSMIYGVLGGHASIVNPVKAWLGVSYNGTALYARLTKSSDVITAETSANGSSWVVDTNFSSTAGAITITGATLDTLTELQAYIAGRTGYDAVIFGDSTDSSTLADMAATTMMSNDIVQGMALLKVQPTSTVAKMHTVTPAVLTTSLPSFSFLINRVLGTNESIAAVGCKINSIVLANTAKDLCKMTITIDGKEEIGSKVDSGLTASSVEAYLTANMKIVVVDYTGAQTVLDEVKDYSLTINANLDDNRNIGSYTKLEQDRQSSKIEISFTANNTTGSYALRTNWTTDKPVSMYVYFKGNDYADTTNLVPYNMLFIIPSVKLTDFSSPLSTPDRLTITGAGTAIKPESAVYTKHIHSYIIDNNTSSY